MRSGTLNFQSSRQIFENARSVARWPSSNHCSFVTHFVLKFAIRDIFAAHTHAYFFQFFSLHFSKIIFFYFLNRKNLPEKDFLDHQHGRRIRH